MKEKLLFLVRYYVYWLLLSIVAKVIFLIYQGGEAYSLTGKDIFRIFLRGLQLDLSLGGYVMILTALILALSIGWSETVLRRIFSVITLFLLVFFAGIVVVDLELFRNWGFHLDTTPLIYLKTPHEAMASTPIGVIIGLFFLMIAFVAGGWWVFRRWVWRPFSALPRQWWQLPLFLVIGGAMIIPVRGGFNVAPMNTSFVFFHPKSMFANQAAVNPVWNFIYELAHWKKFQSQYRFMPTEQAEAIVDSLVKTDTVFPRLFNQSRPNVVFLLLESFTANAIEALGGTPGVTPQLNALAKEGVLFSQVYASSTRSDRGMLAAVSGFPSHPAIAMIRYPNKVVQYPRLPSDLEKLGYATRFYYAGDINFGGFRSYVTLSFQDMVTEADFSGEAAETRFKWGIHDEYMFQRLYEDVKQAPQPFMYMAFNLDSHEPFEVPVKPHIPGDDREHKFLNAIWYTDSCIGSFVRQYKEAGLWENTLFILMADHGTRHIGQLSPTDPAMYRIPLILSGGALQVKDTVISTIGSQTDMVATVLAQLGMEYSGYRFSRNLLAEKVIPFAFFSYPEGAGVVTERGTTVYNFKGNQFLRETDPQDAVLLKAYLQTIDQTVNGY